VFFLAFVMLTEPATSPSTRGNQMWYGALVGALMPPQVNLFGFYSSPEIALIIGNMFAYVANPRAKLFPVLKEKIKVAANTADFIFYPERQFAYQPGQYMEFTLPHAHSDSRGDRRYFTLASSPTEPELRIGVKFYDQGSSYKEAMLEMDRNTKLVADHVSGDFTLPKDASKKLAFIAGGIGITPFRSMVKYLVDTDDHRPVSMIYSARTQDDVAYAPIFTEASNKVGMKTVYILTDEPEGPTQPGVYKGGPITAEIIAKEIPDYEERIFYISGTHPMVEAVQAMLRGLGVPRRHIKTDFFPGYA
jgi:ferredoxin-NADP reductase